MILQDSRSWLELVENNKEHVVLWFAAGCDNDVPEDIVT